MGWGSEEKSCKIDLIVKKLSIVAYSYSYSLILSRLSE